MVVYDLGMSVEKILEPDDKSAALNEISVIEGEIAQMGANDSEFNSLQLIRERLLNGEITPEEAILQAEHVRNLKSDYH